VVANALFDTIPDALAKSAQATLAGFGC